jgi:hypothetical protein
MIKLKDILLEILLKEIDEKTTLYHRSPIKLKEGDTIKPNKDESGHHWLESKFAESALEFLRQEENPNAPSRFDCVYSSVIPRSRFVDKGYLYEIKPKGKIHIADSSIIDDLNERFERNISDDYGFEYADKLKQMKSNNSDRYKSELISFLPDSAYDYWKGAKPTKSNLKNIEVLSDSAIVVREVIESEKATPFKVGDKVEVTESNKLYLNYKTIYVNTTDYNGKNKKQFSSDEIDKMVEYLKTNVIDSSGTVIRKDEDWAGRKYTNIYVDGTLKKGSQFFIADLKHKMAFVNDYDDGKSKYSKILLDPIVDGTRIYSDGNENDGAIYGRLELTTTGNEKVPNFADYLKTVQ